MKFEELLQAIAKHGNGATPGAFVKACEDLEKRIFKIDTASLLKLLLEIGSIPESIRHDSSGEKLFAKAADIVLARCFHELGMKATVNKERADCADVVAKSSYHNYSLVADAKAFRLSRTAKNQKDFKVKSMADWRGTHDYAVLACPYFQYPKKSSQIYGQALDTEVCLLGWEHMVFFIREKICESPKLNLANVWGISQQLAAQVTIAKKNRKDSFHRVGNELICRLLSLDYQRLKAELVKCRAATVGRAQVEIHYWTKHEAAVKKYTKEQAIAELISTLKVHEKVAAIQKFVKQLPADDKLG
jgi:type II restriction enzyme